MFLIRLESMGLVEVVRDVIVDEEPSVVMRAQ